jgi:uncharacterized protein (DUF3084 family)
MSTVAKILVVLNLILAGFFLASASNYLGQQDNFSKKLTAEIAAHDQTRKELTTRVTELEDTVRQQQKDTNALREERSVAQAETQRLDAALKHMTEAYDQVAENSTRAQRAVDQLTNSLNATRALNDALTKDNTQLREGLTASANDRDAKVSQVNALQMQLQNETERANSLETKLATAKEENERQAFTIAWFQDRFPGVSAVAQPAHTGRILAANNKDNVYVISLGEEDGVKAGFQYIVSRGDEYVATIQINDVQAKQAAGFALKGMSKGEVRRSDTVMSGR